MKKVLITGVSSGIGYCIAERLLKQDVSVLGLARRAGHQFAEFPHYQSITVDFSDAQRLEPIFKKLAAEHGEVDTLILCSGYGKFAELEQLSLKDMQQMLQVNFMSQALLVKMLLPTLKQKTHAKIIFLGSEAGLDGQKKGSMYCASKFALRGFAQSVRQECKSSGVAVTMINPGFVDTPFFDALNFKPGESALHSIQPEQVADMVQWVLATENNCVVEEINCQPLQKVIVKKTAVSLLTKMQKEEMGHA